MSAPTTAVVPLRDGKGGKTRLSESLPPAERTALVAVLARHVVEVLAATPGIGAVLVVTEDPEFAGDVVADLAGVRVERQSAAARGLNAAIDHGRDLAWAGLLEEPVWAHSGGDLDPTSPPSAEDAPTGPLLVVHADLPALEVDDVETVLAAPAPVVLAPDRVRGGTNALLLRPGPAARIFRFRFGADSFEQHLTEARARGLEAALVERPGSQVDLDTPQDWAALPESVRARLLADVPGLDRLG